MKAIIGLVIGVLTLFLSTIANANLVENGSFEDGSSPYEASNWVVFDIERVTGYWSASDGVYTIDLNMSSPGWIKQQFSTQPGIEYAVSFDMYGNTYGDPQIKTLSAKIYSSNNLYQNNYSFNIGSSIDWESHIFYFVADEDSATIQFSSLGGDYYGPVIDNIIVSPVPITGAVWLLGSGIIGIAGLRRRFKK